MKSKFSPMHVCKCKYETCYYNLYSTRSYKLQHVQADVKSFPKNRVAFSSTLLCIVQFDKRHSAILLGLTSGSFTKVSLTPSNSLQFSNFTIKCL